MGYSTRVGPGLELLEVRGRSGGADRGGGVGGRDMDAMFVVHRGVSMLLAQGKAEEGVPTLPIGHGELT